MTKKLLTLVFAVTTALGPAGGLLRPVPALAQAGDNPDEAKEAVVAGEGPDTRPQKPLSLQQAIEAAVANNLQVAIRRKDPEIADLSVTFEDAAFDPLLSADGSYGKTTTEPLSDFESTGNKFWAGSVSLQQVLKQGFSYSATWSTNKNRAIYSATEIGRAHV